MLEMHILHDLHDAGQSQWHPKNKHSINSHIYKMNLRKTTTKKNILIKRRVNPIKNSILK